jgi:hypothetical protein
VLDTGLAPVLDRAARAAGRLRSLAAGRVQTQALLLVLGLVGLLVWLYFFPG